MSGAVTVGVAVMMTLTFAQAENQREYVDPGRRFRFSYPAEFGAPSRGTNDGFEDRLAAIRFATFPSGIGGEAALTRGLPVVDFQAAGGLYDPITLEIFPEEVAFQPGGPRQPRSVLGQLAALVKSWSPF